MPDLEIEKLYSKPVIGLDEVGRGPIAGPVVSCGCIFKEYDSIKDNLTLINDSKKLNSKKENQFINFYLTL